MLQRSSKAAGDTTRSLAASVVLFAWFVVILTVSLQLIVPDRIETYSLYPLLVGTVLLGLPHGAFDHLLPLRVGVWWGRKPRCLGVYLTCYVVLMAGYFCLWLWTPELAFAGFLIITIFHWGQGDQRFMETFLGRLRPTRWGVWVTLWVRGGLPIVLPVWAFPETAQSLFHFAALGLGLERTTLEIASPWSTAPLLVGAGLVLAGYLVNAVQAAPNASVLAIVLFELIMLTVLFTLVPAYLAIGLYFACWHSLRHLARLLILGPGGTEGIAPGRLLGSLRQLTLALLPLTFVALTLLGGLYVVSADRVTTLEGFVALYLVLISSLTLPHTVVVALIDVWEPAVV